MYFDNKYLQLDTFNKSADCIFKRFSIASTLWKLHVFDKINIREIARSFERPPEKGGVKYEGGGWM